MKIHPDAKKNLPCSLELYYWRKKQQM